MTVLRSMRGAALVALLSLPLSMMFAGSASAAQCAPTGVLTGCSQPSSPQPSSSGDSQPAAQPAPKPAPAPAGVIAEEPGAASRLLDLVNRDRASAGLPALAARSQIDSIAQGHSADMARRRTIWHNDSYFTEATRRSLNARGLGENVAMNGSVDDAHRRLMASPGHRANILKEGFDAVGISVVRDERGVFYVTENFVDSAVAAAPASAQATAAAKPSGSTAATVLAASQKPAAAPPALAADATSASPAELDRTDGGVAPSPDTGGSPSGRSAAGALGGAVVALLGALAALVRLS